MPYRFLANRTQIEDHWNKQSFLIAKGVDICEGSIPSTSELLEAFSGGFNSGNWIQPLEVNINASKVDPDGRPNQLVAIDIGAARELYASGFSVCLGDLSVAVESLAALKQAAAIVFGNPELILVTGYLSPPNVTGLLHYDRQHNFFIQCEGVKRWYVSERPAIKNPHENLIYPGTDQAFFDAMRSSDYDIALPKDCGKQIYELDPGDVLYVPPGHYHSPETLEEHSLHYTLTLEPACFWKVLNKELFSIMLANNQDFFQDQRFLSATERARLRDQCKDQIIKELSSRFSTA